MKLHEELNWQCGNETVRDRRLDSTHSHEIFTQVITFSSQCYTALDNGEVTSAYNGCIVGLLRACGQV